MKNLLLTLAFGLLSTLSVAQNQYFVSASGSDSNSGTTLGSPWQHISKGIATANLTGGAVVHVAAGTYGESIACSGRTAAICMNRSGPSPTQRFILKCDAPWSVPTGSGCLVRNNGANGGISILANNVDVQGFDFTSPGQVVGIVNNCTPNNLASGNCPTGNSVHIIDNYLHDIAQTANDGGVTGCVSFGAIYVGSTNHGTAYQNDVQIIGNRISNYGLQSLAQRNGGSCNLTHGIYSNTPNVVIQNNVIIAATTYNIQIYNQACNAIISNNTSDLGGKGNIVIANGTPCAQGPTGRVTISNNIFESAPDGAVTLGTGGGSPCTSTSRVLISNNLISPGLAITNGSLNGCTDISGTVAEAPNVTFTSYSAGSFNNNYQILSPSLGVGTGTTSCVSGGITPCVPSLDFNFVTRPNPPSRGAFELAGGHGSGPVSNSTLTPTTWDFGTSPVGTPTSIKSFTFTSTGTGSVTLVTESIADLVNFSFGGTGTCANGQVLSTTTTCTVSAKCTPSAVGTFTTNLTVTDNGQSSPHVIGLSCTGNTTGGTPAITLSQANVDFSNVSVNSNSTGPVVTVSNSGTGPLLISSLGGEDATAYSHLSTGCLSGSIPAGGHCTITPVFSPQTLGTKTSSITITANTTPTTKVITLTGVGVQSALGVSPSSLTFSDTPVGSTTPSQAVTVSNSSTVAPANITIALTGPYSQTNTCSDGFTDSFSTLSLSPLWVIDTGSAPGTIPGVNTGVFSASNVDLSQGALGLKLTQTGSAPVLSTGAEVRSKAVYGFGTYDWLMRSSSTSTTPNGVGSVTSGQIASAFTFVNNSQTEIDNPEIEGQFPNTLEYTSWLWTTTQQAGTFTLANPEAAYHHYKIVWAPASITFFLDGTVVRTNTSVVPQVPAYILMNHWGTNSVGFGGLATVGTTRWQYFKGFTFTPSSAFIPAGGSCTINVAFQPTASGPNPGTLTVSVPDGGASPNIPLGGNGVISSNGVIIINGVKLTIGVQILK